MFAKHLVQAYCIELTLPSPDELASDLVSSKLNSDVKFKVGSSGGGGEVLLGVGQKGYNPV